MDEIKCIMGMYIEFMKLHSKDALARGTERKTCMTFSNNLKDDLPDTYYLSDEEEHIANAMLAFASKYETCDPPLHKVVLNLSMNKETGEIKVLGKEQEPETKPVSVFAAYRELKEATGMNYIQIIRLLDPDNGYADTFKARMAAHVLDEAIRKAAKNAMKNAKKHTRDLNSYQRAETEEYAVRATWKNLCTGFSRALMGAFGYLACHSRMYAFDRFMMNFVYSNAREAIRTFSRAILYTEEAPVAEIMYGHLNVFPVRKEIFNRELDYAARLGNNDELALLLQLINNLRLFPVQTWLDSGMHYSSGDLEMLGRVSNRNTGNREIEDFFETHFVPIGKAARTAIDDIIRFIRQRPYTDFGDVDTLRERVYPNVLRSLANMEETDLQYILRGVDCIRSKECGHNPLRMYPGAIIYKTARHEIQREIYTARAHMR